MTGRRWWISRCGAKSRKGRPFQGFPVLDSSGRPINGRCRFHSGAGNSGPRTEAGKRRVGEATSRRNILGSLASCWKAADLQGLHIIRPARTASTERRKAIATGRSPQAKRRRMVAGDWIQAAINNRPGSCRIDPSKLGLKRSF
jgi:hypothetical protein